MQTKKQRRAEAEAEVKVKAENMARQEYWITDPNMRNIGPVKIQPGQKTVVLTFAEAKMFIGAGLTTVDPEETAARIEADRAKQAEAEAETIRKGEEAAARARTEAERQEKPEDGGEAAGGGEGAADPAAAAGTPPEGQDGAGKRRRG